MAPPLKPCGRLDTLPRAADAHRVRGQNSVRTPGPAETEEWKRVNSKAKAEKAEADAATRAKEDAEKAREERVKAKRRSEKKRKKAAAKSEL